MKHLCVYGRHIYRHLKKRGYRPGHFISKEELKEVLFRTLFNKGGDNGGDRKGFLREDLPDGIIDLYQCAGIFRKINYNKFEILCCDKRIKRKWII